MIASEPVSMVSSAMRSRSRGASALPAIVSSAATTSDRPNQANPLSWSRYQKNRWKNVNPTLARMSSIAVDASTTRLEWSSATSELPASRDATTSRGRRVADTNATAKIAAEYSRVAVGPMVFCIAAAGSTATNPTRPEMRPSFEFASTSSSSLRTTLGTSALFEIVYVFCSTIAAKASGNSSTDSM